MIHSKKMLIMSLLLAASPLCAAPKAVVDKNQKNPAKKVTQSCTSVPQTAMCATPITAAYVVQRTTQQIMEQSANVACVTSTCTPQSKEQPKKVGQTWGPTYDNLANHVETGSILQSTLSGALSSQSSVGSGGSLVLAMDNRIRSFCYNAYCPADTITADQVLNVTPDQFFSAISDGAAVRGTQVVYDLINQLWYITAFSWDTNQADGKVLLAVAQPTPLGSQILPSTVWNFIVVDTFNAPVTLTNPGWSAGTVQPQVFFNGTIGYDGTNVYLAAYIGGNTDLLVATSVLYAINVTGITGANPSIQAWRNVAEFFGGPGAGSAPGSPNAPFELTPVTYCEPGRAPANTAYVLGFSTLDFFSAASNVYGTGTQGQIFLLTIDFSVTPAQLTNQALIVPAYYQAINTPLTPPTINANQTVTARTVFRQPIAFNQAMAGFPDGFIYACMEIAYNSSGVSDYPVSEGGTADRNGVRWYQISPASTPIVLSNDLYDNTAMTTPQKNIDYFAPSILAIGDGMTVVIGASIDGTALGNYTGYLSSCAVEATVTPATPQAPPLLLATSYTPYYPADDWFLDPSVDWAQLSSTVYDPVGNIWTFQPYGYNFAQGAWAVSAGLFQPTFPPPGKAKPAKKPVAETKK